jgi:signal transduction histidine kinase/CheY-like chemotaxis protein/HPt (histidine-containing phosphotransfer) domain-containing protein
MTVRLSYRRLGFFATVTTAGWLLNLLALQLPLLMPLLSGNISALLLTLRLGPLWGLLSLPLLLWPVADPGYWLSSLLQVLVVATVTVSNRTFFWRLAVYALLMAVGLWGWPGLLQMLPGYSGLLFLLLLLHFAVNLYGCGMLLDITANEQTLKQQSLQHQLASHIAAYAVIPVSFVVAVGLNAAIVQDLSSQNARLSELKQQFSAAITQKLSHFRGILAFSSHNLDDIQPPLLLQNLVTTTPEFISALVTDAQGRVQHYYKEFIEQDIRGASVAHRAYFIQPSQTGLPYISEVFQGEKLGNDWLFAVSHPYFDAGKFSGVIEASVLLTKLTEQFQRLILPRGCHIVLHDSAQRNLWSSEPFAVGQPVDLAWLGLDQQQQYFQHSWFNPLTAVVLTSDSHYLLRQQEIQDTRWQLLIYQDNLPHLLRYHGYLLLALLLLLGLMVVMRASAARFVSSYTNTLSTLVQDLEQFKLGHPPAVASRQLAPALEFDQLALSLNQMQRRISFTHQQLQKVLTEKTTLSAELEQRVSERTAELSAERDRATRLAEAKNRFLANMSHELRTPLAIIQGFTLQLQKVAELQHYQNELRSIESNCVFLLHIVNDILDSAKMEENKLKLDVQLIDFAEFLQELRQSIEPGIRQKGLQFEFIHTAQLPAQLQTDTFRLKQILMNLFSNALKFTSEGFIRFEVDYQAPHLLLAVTDSGIGISPAQQGYIFEAFEQADISTTRQYGGTGLGLYICKKLAELLGIRFGLQSEAGLGSRFTLQWTVPQPCPVTTLCAAIQPIASKQTDHVQYRATVLLADDVAELRQLFRSMLTQYGLQVLEADNGAEALTILQRQAIDLILLDMHMPVKDGLSTLKELRSAGFQQPVLALTADVLKEKHLEMQQAGCQQILTKPLSEEALMQAIAPYLQSFQHHATGTSIADTAYDDLQLSFLASLTAVQQQLSDYRQQAESAMLLLLLHKTKGTAACFEFRELAKLAKDAEHSLRQQQSAVVELDALQRHISHLQQSIPPGSEADIHAEP